MDPERLNNVLKAVGKLAADDVERAVHTLLGSSPEVWADMFGRWNSDTVATLTGSVQDLRFPVARGFTIPREAVPRISEELETHPIVALHGAALCGITNTLVQFTEASAADPVLFVDRSTRNVLRYIANRLARETSSTITEENVRGWFNSLKGIVQITLVLDAIPADQFDELVEYAASGLLRLVVGVDSAELERLSTVLGRQQQTLFGRTAGKLELGALSAGEFETATKMLAEEYKAQFYNGARHIPGLRSPRALRILAATLPKRATLMEGASFVMLPIPGPDMLGRSSQAFASSPPLKFDLALLAEAYLSGVSRHVADPTWVIETWGRPSVAPRLLRTVLGELGIERLCKQGFLSWIDTKSYGPCLLVRIEEVLLHHIANLWARDLQEKEGESLKNALRQQLKLSGAIPSGELAAARAIIQASGQNPAVLGSAIELLWYDRPRISHLREGAVVSLLHKGTPIRLHFGEGMDEEVVGNLLPWVVLSHLAACPMAQGEDKSVNLDIFGELGNFPHLLFRPAAIELDEISAFHMHDIGGVGSIPCLSTGIIEPLLQSMLQHAQGRPDELIELANVAATGKKASHLGWRVWTVASAMLSNTDERVSDAAIKAQELLKPLLDSVLQAHAEEEE